MSILSRSSNSTLGVSGVVHVAGGFSEIIDIDESIRSEVAAIKDILADAAATGSVKRFVYTSSALAVSSPTVNEVFTYEQGLWNDRSIQQAHKKPKDPYPDQSYINFAACRTSSEHAIWRFVREQNPGFALNTVLPNFTMGPAPILEGISGNTRGFFRGLIHNVEGDVKILQALGSQYWVNVEDVALVHIGALIYEDVKEERLLTFPPNGKYSYNGWVDIASERYPLRTDGPPKIADPGPDLSSVDDRRALELLRRLGREGWTGWEETLRASLE